MFSGDKQRLAMKKVSGTCVTKNRGRKTEINIIGKAISNSLGMK